jgi:hypothetical protein
MLESARKVLRDGDGTASPAGYVTISRPVITYPALDPAPRLRSERL